MTLQEILQAFQLGKISFAEAKKALASIETSQDPPPQGTHKGCPYNGTDTPCEPLRTIVGASLVGALGDSPQRMERRKEAIAIVGISGRYPDARNLTAYWANLMQGKNAIREIPLARFAVSDYYDPKRAAPGKIYCKWLGALDEIEYFDPLFFALSPAEAEVMDPQGRIFLEEGYKAFEDAGYSPQLLSNRKCGVYLGISGYEYGLLLSQQQGMETDLLGTSAAIAVARIAYLLNLKGPAIAIDTACSSSLVATHLACQALSHQEIDMALVGGVSLYLTPDSFIGMCGAGMLSPDGQCKTFDASADGFVPGEGVGALVLKRLADAEADHDQIYGVIIGSGINQDGATNGITAPSVKSQSELEREIYEKYAIDPDSISYVEMHGTGTKLGDPIELEALATVFQERTQRKQYCAIGSVKSNIGHTSAAAGVAGLHKVLLAMQQKKLVPTLHFQQPNEHFDFAASPFYVNTRVQDWHTAAPGIPRRAAVSSFGFSGTNAHLVIEEYLPASAKTQELIEKIPSLVILSAKSESQLKSYAQELKRWIQAHEELALVDIAFTLQVGRSALEHRVAIIADTRETLLQRLEEFADNQTAADIYMGQVKRSPRSEAVEVGTCDWREKKLAKIAQLWVEGMNVDWLLLYTSGTRSAQGVTSDAGPLATAPALAQRVSLPTYPFARQRYWVPTTTASTVPCAYPSKSSGTSPQPCSLVPLHPLVQRNTSTLWQQSFSSTFRGDEFFLADHVINGQRIMPGVAYLEMARAAVSEAVGADVMYKLGNLYLSHVVWIRPLVCNPEHPVTLHITLSPADENGTILFVISRDNTNYGATSNEQAQDAVPKTPQEQESAEFIYCQGIAQWQAEHNVGSTASQSLDLAAVQARCQHQIPATACYERYRALGLNYGPAYQAIEQLSIAEGEVLARFRLPVAPGAQTETAGDRRAYGLHPSILDAAFHASISLQMTQNEYQGLYVPFALDELEIIGEVPTQGWARISQHSGSMHMGTAGTAQDSDPVPTSMLNIEVCDDAGRVAVRLRGLSGRLFPTQEETRTLLLIPGWREEALVGNSGEISPSPTPRAPTRDAPTMATNTPPKLIRTIVGASLVGALGVGEGLHLIQPLVLLCDLPAISSSRIQTQLPQGGHCRRLHSSQVRRELRFQEIVVQLIQELQRLRQSPSVAAQSLEKGQTPILVQVVVSHSEEPSLLPALASALKVAQQEYLTLRGQLIEVEGQPEEADLLAWLRENQLRPQEAHIRYRDGKRWVREWQEVSASASVPWQEGGCYLITGGAGGIARLFVQEIARQLETATIVLVGRSALSVEQRAQLAAVRKRGIHIDYQQADVSNGSAVQALIHRVLAQYQHLHGIVHAAGVVRNAPLFGKTEQEVLAVLAPKVIGVELLDEASRAIPLDFFVLCSSLAAVLGGVGLVDYAAANGYLDAFAHARRAKVLAGERHGITLSINWPYWEAGGMQTDLSTIQTMRELVGEEPMGAETGMNTLYQALALDAAQVVVLHGQVARIKQQLLHRFPGGTPPSPPQGTHKGCPYNG